MPELQRLVTDDFGFTKILIPEFRRTGGVDEEDANEPEFVELGETDPPEHVSPFISLEELRAAVQAALNAEGENILAPEDPRLLLRLLCGKLRRHETEAADPGLFSSMLRMFASLFGYTLNISIDPSALVKPLLYASGTIVASSMLWAVGAWEYIPAAVALAIVAYSATSEGSAALVKPPSSDELDRIATFLNGGIQPENPAAVFSRLRHAVGVFSKESKIYFFVVDDMPSVAVGPFLVPTTIVYTDDTGALLPCPVFQLGDGTFRLRDLITLFDRTTLPVAMRRFDPVTGATVTIRLSKSEGEPGFPISLLHDIVSNADSEALDEMYVTGTIGTVPDGDLVFQQALYVNADYPDYHDHLIFGPVHYERFLYWSSSVRSSVFRELPNQSYAKFEAFVTNRVANAKQSTTGLWRAAALTYGWATTTVTEEGDFIDYNYLDLIHPDAEPRLEDESYFNWIKRVRAMVPGKPLTYFDVLVAKHGGVLPPPVDFLQYERYYREVPFVDDPEDEDRFKTDEAAPAPVAPADPQVLYKTKRRIYVPKMLFNQF